MCYFASSAAVLDSKKAITLALSSADASPLNGFILFPGTVCSGLAIKRSSLGFIPDEVRALHRTGIPIFLQRTGFPADNLVQVRTKPIVPFSSCMTGAAGVVKYQLP